MSLSALICGGWHTHSSNESIGFLQNVRVCRLLSREKTNRHKEHTKHEADQHNLPMSTFVGVVK
jgi:hypothetical protein